MLIGGAVLLLLLLLLLGAVGFNVLAQRGDEKPILAQGGQVTPVLQDQAAVAPVLQDDAAPTPVLPDPAKMPGDVAAWLEHLRVTEERRARLSRGQIGSLATLMVQLKAGPALSELRSLTGGEEPTTEIEAPTAKLAERTREVKREWFELNEFFMSKPAPAECIPVQTAYRTALGETSGMMIEIMDAIANSAENPDAAVQALTQMQGTSAERIDVPTKKADQLVAEICAKYGVAKWFSLASDFGSGLLDRLGGLGF